MTAEIGILNKTAVVLAADSAVTISAGSSQEKIYDSADKLFELSCGDPIGVMVNGDMNFMQAPLSVLVKDYRNGCVPFKAVTDAAESFLQYLEKFGVEAPEAVKVAAIRAAIEPPLRTVITRADDAFIKRIVQPKSDDEAHDFTNKVVNLRREALSEQLGVMRAALQRLQNANFLGKKNFKPKKRDTDTIDTVIAEMLSSLSEEDVLIAREIGQLALSKRGTGPTHTGVIVAGFGVKELFPTLVAFELYGVVGDRLKFAKKEMIDIDRQGTKAKVVPFAQREMVERFLYGLDDSIKRNITTFCKASVPKIREKILDMLDMSEDDATQIGKEAVDAENAFFEGLANDSFDAIRAQSQAEIEDMVEFMPKPEMARMAEALVNLTSIKRRVSRGMETVGGPIDVAVISKAEGFVWVKRKHYFASELNARYFDRMRARQDRQEERHGYDMHSGYDHAAGGSASPSDSR